jgi:hypothetical protein
VSRFKNRDRVELYLEDGTPLVGEYHIDSVGRRVVFVRIQREKGKRWKVPIYIPPDVEMKKVK